MDEPQSLADGARLLETRLFGVALHLDDSWRDRVVRRWPVLSELPEGSDIRGRLLGTLLFRDCRTMPSALRLTAPEIRLALLERSRMQRSLMALALARRPGALRCCIDRAARDALREALGELFEPLESLSACGRPVSADVAAWSPLHWACLGFVDWLRLLGREDRLFSRLVGLCLPAGLLEMRAQRRSAAAELKPQQALLALEGVQAQWPC